MASDTIPQHEAETGQGDSPFFSLPAELRNDIYELALSADSKEPIELLSASPPSNAMVTTCRQAYNEAANIYNEARLRYYSTNQFFIVAVYMTALEVEPYVWNANAFLGEETLRSIVGELTSAESSGWHEIQNITVTLKFCSCSMIYRLLPQLGAWEKTMVQPPTGAVPPKKIGYTRVTRLSTGGRFLEVLRDVPTIATLPQGQYIMSMKEQLIAQHSEGSGMPDAEKVEQ
ncbi:hypothetical protein LTR97_008260 [Elasticomyces elasticus]|uniref:F-box domain-containing protein n=1 Tax=Elasticomyces elasticus TaxID=574655 RepID=A0AAN7W4V7_9PEZI|nr:hypothetical protein LTR97_008260 [Elasticomyces elasticus]KAK5719158.1 hypothetical protein LTR15_007681 [Elasticomyces elasticus]